MEHITAVAEYVGLDFDSDQSNRFTTYIQWLGTEGIRAGGIGPEESVRIERRHVADSLLFAVGIPEDATSVWDLGTGVGLPGVPLAIAMPDAEFLLVDRSGRRVDLLRRAVRILDLKNCQVLQGEINDLEGNVAVIVARASLPPPALAKVAERHLDEDGVVVAGGSWVMQPDYEGWESKEIPRDVLDQTIWLLMMRRA